VHVDNLTIIDMLRDETKQEVLDQLATYISYMEKIKFQQN